MSNSFERGRENTFKHQKESVENGSNPEERELSELEAAIALERQEVAAQTEEVSHAIESVDDEALSTTEKTAFGKVKEGCRTLTDHVLDFAQEHPRLTTATTLIASVAAFAACFALLRTEGTFVDSARTLSGSEFIRSPTSTITMPEHVALITGLCGSLVSAYASLVMLIEQIGSTPAPKWLDRLNPDEKYYD